MKTENKIIALFFYGAMAYQLFYVNNIVAENKTNVITRDNVFNESTMFNDDEQSKNIEQVSSKKIVKHHPRKRYKLSKKGKNFIKKHETCVLHAYNDPDPKRRSVGWGHQIQPGENLEHITKAKADELFEKDVEWVNDAINRLIAQQDNRFTYSQGFIDGLGSLIYNCGERGVTLTEFWARWKKCRYDASSPEYINRNDWNYTIAAVKTSRISAPGHIERRYNEHMLMLD